MKYYIKQWQNVNKIDTQIIRYICILLDADGLQEYKRREQEIINVVNEQEQSTLAYVHCNSEQILLGINFYWYPFLDLFVQYIAYHKNRNIFF